MSFNYYDLKHQIVIPALNAIGMLSDSAVNLLLGTCAQESDFGRYLIQKKIGYLGGIGIYQMQKPTYEYTWDRKVSKNVAMKAKIRLFLGYEGMPPVYRLASDLSLATIMCRLYYSTFESPLPDAKDANALGEYWKANYNTFHGKGTVEQFVVNYNHYVKE